MRLQKKAEEKEKRKRKKIGKQHHGEQSSDEL